MDKAENVTKLKCEKTENVITQISKLKMWQNSKLKMLQNSKTEIGTNLKN